MRASGTAWVGSSSPESHPKSAPGVKYSRRADCKWSPSAGEDWYVFVFTAHDISGSLIESREGDLEWVDDDKLLELELWEGDRYFLDWLDQPGFFSGKFCYEDGHLVDHNAVFYT
jgi:8-oxo-dGTP pyrophosphatase MutT (NUDIX family)